FRGKREDGTIHLAPCPRRVTRTMPFAPPGPLPAGAVPSPLHLGRLRLRSAPPPVAGRVEHQPGLLHVRTAQTAPIVHRPYPMLVKGTFAAEILAADATEACAGAGSEFRVGHHAATRFMAAGIGTSRSARMRSTSD